MDLLTSIRSSLKTAWITAILILVNPLPGSAADSGFDKSAIIEHLQFLASDSLEGRRGGSMGARIASEYIKEHFEKLGLEPGGDEGTFFQEFSFVSDVIPAESNELVIECRGETFTAKQGIDFSPMSSSATTTAEGRLIFIGYGLKDPEKEYDDFVGTNLEGAVAVALEGIPPALEGTDVPHGNLLVRKKAMLAREAGAAGLLLVQARESENPMDKVKYDGVPGDVGISFARVSRDFVDEVFGCAWLSSERVESVPSPHAMENVSVRLRTDVIQKRAMGNNVIARLSGSDPLVGDQYVVVGAHYDHIGMETGQDGGIAIYNGADDNASGVAGLLELASSLSADHPRRSILFISFDAEELGALGSLHFMKNPTIPKEKISAMVNLDMIGRMSDGILIVSGYDTSPMWDKLIERSNEGFGLDIKKSGGGFGGSDHTSFYKDNIPVLFFFTGAHDDYNTPNDDWDRINVEGEAIILEYVDRIIEEIGNSDDPPPFSRSQAGKSGGRGRSALSVYMGTVPDFTHEGDGFAIIGTKEGSPAEKAGLIKGDVIIRIEETEVRNIYDFMGVLSDHKPGDVITVVVTRDDNELSLKVTLEKK